MAKEIEYKFLANQLTLHAALNHKTSEDDIYQGYLPKTTTQVQLVNEHYKGTCLEVLIDGKSFLIEGVPEEDATALKESAKLTETSAVLDSSRFTIRVRLVKNTRTAFFTIKSKSTGISRDEFEYPMVFEEALALSQCPGVFGLEKTRYGVMFQGFLFEIDVFKGNLEGLITAEVEVPDESVTVPHPAWVGKDVSEDFRYTNVQLALNGIPM